MEQTLNPKPKIADFGKDSSYPMYAPTYDFEKQRKVYEAYQRIHQMSADTSLFPFLIEKWDDGRYSMCWEFNGFAYIDGVGGVCRKVVFHRIEPYQGFTNYEKRIRLPSFSDQIYDKKAAQKWWSQNKDKSLLQIQLDVMDWTYQEMEKDKERYTDEDRAKYKKARRALMEDGKAILREPSHRYFIGKMPGIK